MAIHDLHLEVVWRMYERRFGYRLDRQLTLEQVRGMEGARVRNTYARASKEYGVSWRGRLYDRQDWSSSDPVNRALSAANACLNGLCHAAIVSVGYSPALGFIHVGRQPSFVYDVAGLYKAEITEPLAFPAVAEGGQELENRVRHACRDAFRQSGLLKRIVPDMDDALGYQPEHDRSAIGEAMDRDMAMPAPLWDELEGDERDRNGA